MAGTYSKDSDRPLLESRLSDTVVCDLLEIAEAELVSEDRNPIALIVLKASRQF
ncbi:hypothetical protein EMCG_09734 [[Emmonsia] crescens]|uniref:Uncharacterized protein n=1 Tax=[Emmonsia] crescens TaxID=73230 RepID=A0A0G2I0Z5_9EURO|nr:hypothetical protein EMCG_09734 [Emmonsia crescens UAMH 3008]